jgi:cytochrome P450
MAFSNVPRLMAGGLPDVQQASAFLDALLAGLYARSTGGAGAADALPVIDDPALARQILARPDIFVKNYAFLDDLARGRFSANGRQWRDRAAATQHWYRSAHRALEPEQLAQIYQRALAGGTALNAGELFACFSAASVEVFSRAIGLPHALPWPTALLDRIRSILKIRQWIDWNGCPPVALASVRRQLAEHRGALRILWQDSEGGLAALAALAARGAPIDCFDAAEELLQNVLASSETVASTLLWAAEALSQQPALQLELRAGTAKVDSFIAEVLRMFPPVPYLTRRCLSDHASGEMRWRAGSVLSVSIVGIHRNGRYWDAPHRFDIGRPEFTVSNTVPDTAPGMAAYLPFSRGERVCAGMRLAQLELGAGVAAMLASRDCIPGATPTSFGYGLSSYPKSSLSALPRQQDLSRRPLAEQIRRPAPGGHL